MRARNVLALFLASGPAVAAETVDLHAFSDVVHRGANLTNGNPGIGVSASWDFSSGWFIGGGGYYADGTPSGLDLTRNLNVNVGWFRAFDQARAMELSVSRVEFPDVDNWDYTEIRADFHMTASAALTLAWSPEYYGRADTVNAAGTWRPRFSDRLYAVLAGGVGYVSDGFDDFIGWGQIGGGVNAGRFDVTLSYSVVDRNTETIFFRPRDAVALRVSYRLR